MNGEDAKPAKGRGPSPPALTLIENTSFRSSDRSRNARCKLKRLAQTPAPRFRSEAPTLGEDNGAQQQRL